MQIVIDLDENIYTRLFDNGIDLSERKNDTEIVATAIRGGTILPKGHGDLIDSSYEVSTDGRTVYDVCGYLAPTIIEADKESE